MTLSQRFRMMRSSNPMRSIAMRQSRIVPVSEHGIHAMVFDNGRQVEAARPTQLPSVDDPAVAAMWRTRAADIER